MISYYYPALSDVTPRTQPWIHKSDDRAAKYYDFKVQPELIREVLEDLRPLQHWPAIQTFYNLITWLNSTDSIFETNDVQLSAIHVNNSPLFKKRFQITGRLCVFPRLLGYPVLDSPGIISFRDLLIYELHEIDSTFEWGAIAISESPTIFLYARDKYGNPEQGVIPLLTFWAWGNTHKELMLNLTRTFENLHTLFRKLSDPIIRITRETGNALLTASSEEVLHTQFLHGTGEPFFNLLVSPDYHGHYFSGISSEWQDAMHLRQVTAATTMCEQQLSELIFVTVGTGSEILGAALRKEVRLCQACLPLFNALVEPIIGAEVMHGD